MADDIITDTLENEGDTETSQELDNESTDAENEQEPTGEQEQGQEMGDEPEPEPRDEWDELLDKFMEVYPEFLPLLENEETAEKNRKRLKTLLKKVSCLYPEFSDLEKCKNFLPYFMLVGHYIAMDGIADELGISGASGVISSSSVGGVSVSYQGTPYTGNDTDEFRYWLGLSKYGKEYLAWLARQSGLMYVNN